MEHNTSEAKTLEERIEEFCTTVVLQVKEARVLNQGKNHMIDRELADYLNDRLLSKNEIV